MLNGLSLGRNGASLLVTAAAALVVVEVVKLLSRAEILSSYTSRKLLHVSIGLIFLGCWPLFSEDAGGLQFCAAVPAAITLQFTVIGAGLYKDEATVKMMSRSGKRQELLLGPLTYGVAMVLLTCVCWDRRDVAVVSISALCAGDGFADIIGRRYPGYRWKEDGKSLLGSVAYCVAALLSVAIFAALSGMGESVTVFQAFVSIFCGALVEALDSTGFDNATATAACAAVAWFCA